VNVADIVVIESRSRLGFVNETLFLFLSLAEILGQELQSDKAVEFCILRFVDNAHSTTAQFFDDFVV